MHQKLELAPFLLLVVKEEEEAEEVRAVVAEKGAVLRASLDAVEEIIEELQGTPALIDCPFWGRRK